MTITPRLAGILHRLRLRIEEAFDQAWASLPAEPVLGLFLFTATLAVIVIDSPPIGFGALGVGSWVFVAWCVLGLVSPVGVFVSHRLIVHHRQRRRLFGFYLRTAADVMQFLALSAYLAARLLVPVDDGLVYSQLVISGIWVLQALWVVREIWALVLIERTATRLNTIIYGQKAAGD